MMGLRLPKHIAYGMAAGRRLFLDLVEDSYFLLPPQDEALFEQLETRGFAPAGHCLRLVEAGILTFSPEGRPVQPTAFQPPASSLIEAEDKMAGASAALVGETLVDLMAARRAVRRRRLTGLAGRAVERGGPARAGHGEAIRKFRAARRLIPLGYNCLRDSLALHGFLKRRGIASNLVIGAKLYPFAAHCWLQAGDVVLNDSLAAAEGFSPILFL